MVHTSAEMNLLRCLVKEIISVLASEAVMRKISPSRLKDIYIKNVQNNVGYEKLVEFDPNQKKSYAYLFGFGPNLKNYMKSDSTTHKIGHRHIGFIHTTLTELKVVSGVGPVIKYKPDFWLDFLQSSLIALRGDRLNHEISGVLAVGNNNTENAVTSREGILLQNSQNNDRLSNCEEDNWIEPEFLPFAVVPHLHQHFSNKLIASLGLDVTVNRAKLIDYVFDRAWSDPTHETFRNFRRVMTFVRTCYPEMVSSKLWFESEDLVNRKFGYTHGLVLKKAKWYRELCLTVDKARVLERYFDLAEQFRASGDTFGFCEAKIKVSHFLLMTNEAGRSRTMILEARAHLDHALNRHDDLRSLHDESADGVYSGIYIALTRSEIQLGNSEAAIGYSRQGFNYAFRAQNRHILGNIFEDRAAMALQEGNPELALKYKTNAISQFELFGDMNRARATAKYLSMAVGADSGQAYTKQIRD